MLLEPRGQVNRSHRQMRLAWFRASAADDAHPFDDTVGLIRELGAEHDVQLFTNPNAHDFVWKHFRVPYDVCVFELDNTPAHAFIWPYLLHYGGVLLLRTRTLHDSRAHALIHTARLDDYVAEFAFNEGYPPYLAHGRHYISSHVSAMLRVPLLASRVTVMPHKGVAEALQDEYPEPRIRYSPLPVQERRLPQDAQGLQKVPSGDVTFGVVSTDPVDVARRALARACETGTAATLLIDVPERVIQRADVVLTLQWPGFGTPHTLALAAMSCGKPVVVLETDASADWPVLDPQTWHPRGFGAAAPIGVSIDLRDEEHSLMLAVRRLAADAALRARLGEAGRAWWRAHATVDRAVQAWRPILREAAALDRPPRPANWPAHLDADGAERAREILREFGVTVDLF